MILPTAIQIKNILYDELTVMEDYGRQFLPHRTWKYFNETNVDKFIQKVIALIKEVQYDDKQTEEEIEVDKNLVYIAELEAKIKVYESVIESAGFNLLKLKKERK